MRIRTAVAAAALATAAVLGSAGSALADNNDNNIAADNDNNNNRVRIDPRIVDFTSEILSRNTSVSDNDTTHNQNWEFSNVSDNWTGNFSGDVSVGDLEFDD